MKWLGRVGGISIVVIGGLTASIQLGVPLLFKYYPSFCQKIISSGPLTINYGHAHIDWKGLRPELCFHDVHVATTLSSKAFTAQTVRAQFTPFWSLSEHRLMLVKHLQIDNAFFEYPPKIDPNVKIPVQLLKRIKTADVSSVEIAGDLYNIDAAVFKKTWQARIIGQQNNARAELVGRWRPDAKATVYANIIGEDLAQFSEILPIKNDIGHSKQFEVSLWAWPSHLQLQTSMQHFGGIFNSQQVSFDKISFNSEYIHSDTLHSFKVADLKTQGLSFQGGAIGTLRPSHISYDIQDKILSLAFSEIDAEFLNPFIEALFPKDKLNGFELIDGTLSNSLISVDFQQEEPHLHLMRADFTNLEFKSNVAAFVQVDGHISLGLDNARLNILDSAVYFNDNPEFNFRLNGPLFWSQAKQILSTDGLQMVDNKHLVSLKGSWQHSQDPSIDAMIIASTLSTQDLTHPVFNQLPEGLTNWLHIALHGGAFSDLEGTIRGSLSQLKTLSPAAVINFSAQFDDLKVDYAPNWPAITSCSGLLQLENEQLHLWADTAQILDTDIAQLSIRIEDIRQPFVLVESQFDASFAKGRQFINNSPLKQTLSSLDYLELDGNAQMLLRIGLPIFDIEKLQLDAMLRTKNASLAVPRWDIAINQFSGDLAFTHQSVHAENMSGKLWGYDHLFSMFSMLEGNEPWIEVTTSGHIDIPELRKYLKLGDNDVVSGSSDYQATLRFSTEPHHQQGHLLMSTLLEGVEIMAPAPLGKTKYDQKPFLCQLYFEPNELMRIKSTYNDHVDLALSFNTAGNRWGFLGGHLHLAEQSRARFREDKYLLVDGQADYLSVERWRAFIPRLSRLWPKSFSPKYEIDAFIPVVDLDIGVLDIFEHTFENIRVEANWQPLENILHVNYHGRKLDGVVTYKKDTVDGYLHANLRRLVLSAPKADSEPFEFDPTAQFIPLMLNIGDLQWGEKHFQNLSLKGLPAEHGYHFEHIKTDMQGAHAELFGDWFLHEQPKRFNLGGRIDIANTSGLLKALSRKGTIYGANGTAFFNVSWLNELYSPLETLSGRSHIKVYDGLIQGVNPGFGKILSLLNLDNMHKRLAFDFTDLTSSGLNFDTITTSVIFEQGQARSNRVAIDGPTAKIEAKGVLDLASNNLQAQVTVMPNVTGSLPLAAAIASANPAIGAAVWVVDKVFGRQIQEISRYSYHIDGTWQTPRVQDSGNTARWDR